MNRGVDWDRLRATLGAPELARLIDALQRRIELGRPLSGTLRLVASKHDERAALDGILGRNATRGDALSVDLDELDATLRDARICEGLAAAIEALRGPVTDRRRTAFELSAAWNRVWRDATSAFASRPELHPWLESLERLGVLRRLCGNQPPEGRALLAKLAHVVAALPASAEPMASFAARLLGDAHALDPGTPLATLAVRAASRIGGAHFTDDAEGRRSAWASSGILCDELSTPVLVFNLPAVGHTPMARRLREACDVAEPLHLSLRMLLRHPLETNSAVLSRDIFVCENPTIVALAANRFGPRCAPLVCVNGQFATPALVLLRQLRAAGARLHYHGDFDPAGLAIARRVIAESGALPWRFGAADYGAAPKGISFIGVPGPTPWDQALQPAMKADGRAVHEEAIFDQLACDLAGDR